MPPGLTRPVRALGQVFPNPVKFVLGVSCFIHVSSLRIASVSELFPRRQSNEKVRNDEFMTVRSRQAPIYRLATLGNQQFISSRKGTGTKESS